MEIKRVDHIAVNTIDFKQSICFYRDLLGFKQLGTVDMGDFTITYLELPGGGRLELFDYRGGNKSCERAESEAGLRHLAFEVDDVRKHEEILRAADVKIILTTTELPPLGARVLLFVDPNGVTLEFCEKL